jgi:hypothetical protein
VSTLWFFDAAGPCVVTDADDASLYQGELRALLTGLVGTPLETGFDTALQIDEGKVYLFQGPDYWRYDLSTNGLDEGYPLATADKWPGTGDTPAALQVTAAAVLPGFQAVLLCDSEVVLYDLVQDQAGGVLPVDEAFAGVPAGTVITAAVTTDAALYLFAGDRYFRVDPTSRTVEDGYPLPVEGNWPALAGFTPTGGFTLRNDVTPDGLVLSPPPPPDDPYAATPARALTVDQAGQVLQALHDQGALQLAAPPRPGWVSLAEARLHGVELRFWNGHETQASALRNLDPRNAVALARLAAWASSSYGVHTIAHIGVNGDDTGARTDCHGQGRAVDLAGVAGTVDGADFSLDVLADWGSRSVPDERDTSAPRLPQWPPGNRVLSYRLEGNPDASALATDLFLALYDFVAAQWQDRTDQPTGAAPTSRIGERSFVMHPDHPASNPGGRSGREAHANHLHLQIGKTGPQ